MLIINYATLRCFNKIQNRLQIQFYVLKIVRVLKNFCNLIVFVELLFENSNLVLEMEIWTILNYGLTKLNI